MNKTLTRLLSVVALVSLLALGAAPVVAQVSVIDDTVDSIGVDLPGVGTVDDILDLVDIPALDIADPILQPVTAIIDDLLDLVGDILADLPLPNLLALQGEDAIDAAIAFSRATYETSDIAVLARDDLFADALTTGSLQGIFDAPLLLTASGDLDRRTALELVRLRADRLIVVGGESAVNPLVMQKLDIAGVDVTRVGGPTRIETAAEAAGATAADATTAVLTRAYSSTGDDSQAYADLLGVSPWAAENGWPVLLTQTEVLTASVRDYIAGSDLTDVIVIGGTSAISQAVEDQLTQMGITVRRVAGDTRYGTAVAIANERGYVDSGDTDRLILAEGGAGRADLWAPGFAAAAHAARNGAPVLLTDGPNIPAETLEFITAGLAENLLDGGAAIVCASFVNPVACEAAGLLMLGHLADALDMLDLGLLDIPGLDDLLDSLGLGHLIGVIESLVDAIAGGDLDAIVDILDDLADPITGIVDGIVDGGDGLLDPIIGGDGDGDILDPITDPLDPILDPITDPLDPILEPIIGDDDEVCVPLPLVPCL